MGLLRDVTDTIRAAFFAILKPPDDGLPCRARVTCFRHCEGTTVKRYALAATLSLLLCGAVQAAAIDLDPSQPMHVQGSLVSSDPNRAESALPASMSELPEPEVFAMMLVGLILIGYKASRSDSGEKFKSDDDEK